MFPTTSFSVAGVSGFRDPAAAPAGQPAPSNHRLPNEVWSRIHRLLDLPGKRALTEVDSNLHRFSLPTAQAHLTTALSLIARRRHGTQLVRRAVVVLQRAFEDSAVRDRHVRKLVGLAATIGHDWGDRKSLDIVHTALCEVVPQLAPELARHVLANLVVLNQRACAAYAEHQLSSGMSHSYADHAMPAWRDLLRRQHEQMRAADTAAEGVLQPRVWQRLNEKVAGSLANA
jgi:hypothetical protein